MVFSCCGSALCDFRTFCWWDLLRIFCGFSGGNLALFASPIFCGQICGFLLEVFCRFCLSRFCGFFAAWFSADFAEVTFLGFPRRTSFKKSADFLGGNFALFASSLFCGFCCGFLQKQLCAFCLSDFCGFFAVRFPEVDLPKLPLWFLRLLRRAICGYGSAESDSKLGIRVRFREATDFLEYQGDLCDFCGFSVWILAADFWRQLCRFYLSDFCGRITKKNLEETLRFCLSDFLRIFPLWFSADFAEATFPCFPRQTSLEKSADFHGGNFQFFLLWFSCGFLCRFCWRLLSKVASLILLRIFGADFAVEK